MTEGPSIVANVSSNIVTGELGRDIHPVVFKVKMKVAIPPSKPVIKPVFASIVAIFSLLLVQIPPLEGVIVVVEPIQICGGAVKFIAGIGWMVIDDVGRELHPVDDSVKLKNAVPAPIPVISPSLFTVATDALLLVQIPPDEGDN